MKPSTFLTSLLLAVTAILPLTASTEAPSEEGRVIVLGMDGMDARSVEKWMDSGDLPNFARLRDQGTFAPLMPANPAQSPVSWATLNTGRNPGKHSIFDFVGVSRHRPDGKLQVPSATVGFQKSASHSWVAKVVKEGIDFNVAVGAGAALGLLLMFVLLKRNKGAAIGALLVCTGLGAGAAFALGESVSETDLTFPSWESTNQAEEFWVELDNEGIPFRGQGTIVSYPAPELKHGKLIAGLGAPDAKGGLNTSAIYTTEKERVRNRKTYKTYPAWAEADATDMKAKSGQRAGATRIYQMTSDGGAKWQSKLFGPMNGLRMNEIGARLAELQGNNDAEAYKESQKLSALRGNRDLLQTWAPMVIEWAGGDAAVNLSVDGVAQTVALDSWSDFYFVDFPWGEGVSTSAMVRFWAEKDGKGLELFASPLQVDPDKPTPGHKFCWPRDFASEVTAEIGHFETLGWACQTHAQKDAELSDASFLGDIEYTFGWRNRMLKSAMGKDDWKVLFHFFGTPDRVCHMLMRHFDESHPQYDAELASRKYPFFGETIPVKDTYLAIYKKMDEVVGYMLDEAMAENDTLMIVSDHGFDSFRRQINLNNWLAEEGFLSFKTTNRYGLPLSKSTMKPLLRRPFGYVDWDGTQAYSLAIGKIYLNLKGREKDGIVSQEDAEKVLADITTRLYEMTDPETGEKIVRKVYLRDEIYSGDWWKEDFTDGPAGIKEGAAELTIDFAPGYRAAWNATAGGMNFVDKETEDGPVVANGDFVYDNTSPWSGDHCGVDMSVLQGIFYSSRPAALPEGDTWYDACHLAPTVLSLMGVDAPADYDRKSLVVN